MDIDTLLTVVFVAVIILFQLFGAVFTRLLKKNQTRPEKPEKPVGLFKELTARVNREIQIAVQQAAKARQTAPAPDVKKPDTEKQPGQRPEKATSGPAAGEKRMGRIERMESHPAAKQTTRFRTADKTTIRTAAAETVKKEKDWLNEIRQGIREASAGESPCKEAPGEESAVMARSARVTGYSPEELRRAVIWSEILAPPVAWRDNHENF